MECALATLVRSGIAIWPGEFSCKSFMNELHHVIADEMKTQGVIPFARFMELALYHPTKGYYETQSTRIGRQGDFYTSVSVGPLFGELLAFQFSVWLESIETPCQIVEAGAHDGTLARDVLSAIEKYGSLSHIEYWIIEPSIQRRAWQTETLAPWHRTGQVHWIDDWSQWQRAGVRGIIFSNELLDAFPVHRLAWNASDRGWFEWGVALDESERFVWRPMPLTVEIPLAPESLLRVLPDGYVLEVSPARSAWWMQAAQHLAHGKLMTIDYGFPGQNLFDPARANGSLRGYHGHRVASNLLENPGRQDLTADVNFGELEQVGEAAGLKTIGLLTQATFFMQAIETMRAQARDMDWTESRRRQLQTLIHPEHLGRAFKVLVQEKKTG
jgi:SAM-dependent MidA family methyltransferase